MICALHQPNYIPWIGYWNKMAMCDLFIIEDSLQYIKRSYINRVKIFFPTKDVKWLTIPVTFNTGENINEVKISNDFNPKNHFKTIQATYGSLANFKEIADDLKAIYDRKYEKLIDLNMELILFIKKKLNIDTKISYLSELEIIGQKSEFLSEICKQVGSDTYLSGQGAKKYIDEDIFKEKQINLIYQEIIHPVYQQKSENFVEGLSILDFIFSCQEYKNIFWEHVKKSQKITFNN